MPGKQLYAMRVDCVQPIKTCQKIYGSVRGFTGWNVDCSESLGGIMSMIIQVVHESQAVDQRDDRHHIEHNPISEVEGHSLFGVDNMLKISIDKGVNVIDFLLVIDAFLVVSFHLDPSVVRELVRMRISAVRIPKDEAVVAMNQFFYF